VRSGLNSPRLGERLLGIPTENEFDVPVGIVPIHQAFREMENFLCIVDSIQYFANTAFSLSQTNKNQNPQLST